MAGTILVIDDENNMRWVLQKAFQRAGYQVFTASRGNEGLQLFARHAIDLVLLDLKMPGMDGLSLLRELRSRDAETPILLFTAYATVATAVEALKVGATDYIRKPFDIEDVLTKISHHLHSAPAGPANQTETKPGFGSFIGASPLLDAPLAQAVTAAESDYTTVICGEQGSGRRYLAQLIHQQRPQGRLVTIDCAGLPAPLLERELLEPVTGEQNQLKERKRRAKDEAQMEMGGASGGRWQQALGGSLLLANCDRLPAAMLEPLVRQVTDYLRAPQRPHGLRLFLTATEPLGKAWHPIEQTAVRIELPSLRQRIDDLYLLLAHFAPSITWDPAAMAHLKAYSWPGNIAELKRLVQQIAPLAVENAARGEHLPPHIAAGHTGQNVPTPTSILLPEEGIALETVEKELIQQALARTEGNKAGAARLLGLTRATLLYRLDKYNIHTEDLET